MFSDQIKKQLKLISAALLYLICIAGATHLLLKGLEGGVSHSSIIILIIGLIFLCAYPKTFKPTWVLFIVVSLYVPIGYDYGGPNFQAISSLTATDLLETVEFLSLIPLKYYLKALAIPILLAMAYWIAQKVHLRPWKNKTVIFASVLALIVSSQPIHFFDKLQKSYEQLEEEKRLIKSMITESHWGKSTYSGTPKDYILVIGESVRRDYMHAYGYPVENTPFIETIPSTIVNGLNSADTYTIGSLRLMLTLPDKEKWSPNYTLNFIDLAKSANFQTYWISNQGYIGKYDTPISAIGSRADEIIFLNKRSYEKARYPDMRLLDELDKQLSKTKLESPRLFVLHLMGSHPHACDRIRGMDSPYTVKNKKLSYVACYVSSIKYTDQFLEKVYQIVKNHASVNKRDFSILYFADHAQAHRDVDGVTLINNNRASKLHYQVPLFLIDSDATTQKRLNSEKFGLSFTEGLATWMHITNDKLKPYDLFDGISDSQDYGLTEKIKNIPGSVDPAIDISREIVD